MLGVSPRLVFVGDSKVGKTAIVRRFVKGTFEERHVPTLGVECSVLDQEFGEGATVWDTGSGLHAGLREGYYIGAWAFVVVFDVNKRPTFESVAKYVNTIRAEAPGRPILLCGNKVDRLGKREVPADEAEAFASENNLSYSDISAKSCHNFEAPFTWARNHFSASGGE